MFNQIGFSVGILARSRVFYTAALTDGGTDNGTPKLRPRYHLNYYGASVLDPDGHNVEAVDHNTED